MAQGPHPWPPRGAFWPPPTPPKHSQCGPVEGAGFVPTSPNQPGHLWLPAGLARGHCTTCGPWGQGLAQRPTPNPWRAALAAAGAAPWKFPGSFPQGACGPNCTTMAGARQHKFECTFLQAVFSPGLIGAARNGPFSSLGVRLAAARAVSWKFPGIFLQNACGPGQLHHNGAG